MRDKCLHHKRTSRRTSKCSQRSWQHQQKPQPTKEQRDENRETVAVACLHCWTKCSYPTFSQCATNASCSWSCIRQNHKHTICMRRVCFDVHVSGWLTLLRCSLWFHLECLAFCSVGSGDTLWPARTLERKQVVSTRHSAASGQGASGTGANAVVKKSTCFWCSK